VTVEINYQTVSRAISLYAPKGYKYVDTPWYVTSKTLTVTLPRERQGFSMRYPELPHDKYLVGSAEQGFLQLMLDGKIQPGSYSSAGPCFRDEPVEDELHRYSFFKLELIKIYQPDEVPEPIDVWKMAHMAKDVHADLYGLVEKSRQQLRVVKTEQGYDLELASVEVGSYGLREHAGHRWLYGTGLALPRAQIALSKINAI
jgi:seryl-tRNA synthetase